MSEKKHTQKSVILWETRAATVKRILDFTLFHLNTLNIYISSQKNALFNTP